MLLETFFLLSFNLSPPANVPAPGIADQLLGSAGYLFEAKGQLEDSRRFWSLKEKDGAINALKKAISSVWKARRVVCLLSGCQNPPKGVKNFPPDMPLEIRCGFERPDPTWLSKPGDLIICAKVFITHRIEDQFELDVNKRRECLIGHGRGIARWVPKFIMKERLARALLKKAVANYYPLTMKVEESFVLKNRWGPYLKGEIKQRKGFFGDRIFGDLLVYKYFQDEPAIEGRKEYWVIGVGPYYKHGVPLLIPPLETYFLEEVSPPIDPKKNYSKVGNPRLNLLKKKIDEILDDLESFLAEAENDGSVIARRTPGCLKGIRLCLTLERGFIGEKKWSSSTVLSQEEVPDGIKGFCLRNPFFREGRVKVVFASIVSSKKLGIFGEGPTGNGVFLLEGKIAKQFSIERNEGNTGASKGFRIHLGSILKMISTLPEIKREPGKGAWFVLSPAVKLPIRLSQVPNSGEYVYPVMRYQPVFKG